MAEITYVTGDATQPVGDDPKIIAHVCNDEGKWGSGFVVALSKRWPEPEDVYRDWYQDHRDGWAGSCFKLGYTRFARVRSEPGLVVANMIAQRGVRRSPAAPPAIRYDALERCLRYVGDVAAYEGPSVHMPRIGCGLAGGTWDQVEPIIIEHPCDKGVPVTVYDLPDTRV